MYDLILKNGLVADGSRAKPYRADICIQNGRIAKIAGQTDEKAKRVLDVAGLVVAPGFIDIHSHSDACPLVDYPVESKLCQGVTTEITGNCGISILPNTPECWRANQEYFFNQLELPAGGLSLEGLYDLNDYSRAVADHGCTGNYGQLIGHGTLRGAVMGFVDRDPTPEEMERLKDLLRRELESGAFGMSLGLIYPPSSFCKTEELVELAKVLKEHDALLTVHMRSEGPRIFQAVDEMLDITRRSGVHLQISHLKLMGKPQWGRAEELLAKLQAAREETGVEMENRGGPASILVSGTHGYHPEWEGKTVEQLSQEFQMDPVDTVIRVLEQCGSSVACIYFCINEEDMLRIMSDMDICVGSDGYNFSYDRSITRTDPHPRSFGTFPRFLRLVREHKLMPLEDAVHKITGLPAQILGLADRGILREGAAADITVFDPEEVRDCSEFTDSVKAPEGIHYVLVGGNVVLQNGRSMECRTGGVLKKG